MKRALTLGLLLLATATSASGLERADGVTDSRGRVLSATEAIPGVGPSTTSFKYDAQGRQVEVRYPDDGGVFLVYDAAGRLRSRTDEANAVTTWDYEADGLVKRIDTPHPDSLEELDYDALGRLVERRTRMADGGFARTKLAYPGDGQVEVTDAEGNVHVRTVTASGAVVAESHLDGGYLISRTFEGSRLKREEVRQGTWRSTTSATWDSAGRLQEATEDFSAPPRGWKYTTGHSWAGTTDTVTHTWSGDDFTGGLSESLTVDAQGLPRFRVRGALTDTWLHDAAGRVVSQAPSGTPATTFDYGSDGRLLAAHFASEKTEYGYDVRGRLHTVATPGFPVPRVLTRAYDARGLVAKETYGVGAEVSTLDFTYDAEGRPLSRTSAKGHLADEAITRFVYGPRGELLQLTQPTPGSVWNYDYDGLGRLLSVTPPAGSLVPQSWRYDGLGREVLHTDGARQWRTDWANGIASTTAPGRDVRARLLDSRGRVLRESVSFSAPSVASYASRSFIYDGLDALRSLTDSLPSVYEYDSSHRLTSVVRGADVVGYGYDGASLRVASVTKGASTVLYGYDATTQRLASVRGPWSTPRDVDVALRTPTAVSWYPGGRLQAVSDDSAYEAFDYDARGQLQHIDYAAVASASRRSYSFDERGNPRTETFGGVTREFRYDAADRLTYSTDWAGVATQLQLHADGTRNTETVGGVLRTYVYAAGALESVTEGTLPVASWAHLPDGRVSSRTVSGVTSQYAWDAFGTLVGASVVGPGLPGVTASYEYDALGLRRRAVVNGAVRSWTWVGESQVAEGDEVLARVGPYLIVQGEVRFEHDALGSVVAQRQLVPPPPPPALPLPLVTSTAQYATWGGQSGGTQLTSNGYTGYRLEEALGLNQAQQRWQDPVFGALLSRDSRGAVSYLSSPNGMGPWSYANLSPLRYADPDGRAPKAGSPWTHVVGKVFKQELDELSNDELRNYLLTQDDFWGETDQFGQPILNKYRKPEREDLLSDKSREYLLDQVCHSLSCRDSWATWRATSTADYISSTRIWRKAVGVLESYEAGWASVREGACELASGATQNAIDGVPGLGNEFGRGLGGGACVVAQQGISAVKGRVDAAVVGGVVTGVGTGIMGTATLAKKGVGAVQEFASELPKLRTTGAVRISGQGPALLGKPSLSVVERSLFGTAKEAKWVTPAQERGVGLMRQPGPGVRDHFRKHGSQVSAESAREYDLSARLTIQNGRRFTYRDRSSNEPRVGYWDPETKYFTATSQVRKTPTILTHFPSTWEELSSLPGFSDR